MSSDNGLQEIDIVLYDSQVFKSHSLSPQLQPMSNQSPFHNCCRLVRTALLNIQYMPLSDVSQCWDITNQMITKGQQTKSVSHLY